MVLKLLDCTEEARSLQGGKTSKDEGERDALLTKGDADYLQDPYASLDPRKTVFQILAEPFWIHHPEMKGRYLPRGGEVNRSAWGCVPSISCGILTSFPAASASVWALRER